MNGADDRMMAYYETELPERAHRPLEPARVEVLAAFVRRCADEQLTEVLEVGCGAGRDGRVLAEHVTYVGVDRSPAGIAICRTLGLDARLADAADLPFDADSFDAVWTMSTLMHLDDESLERALDEVARVTRAGGVIAIGVWGADARTLSFDDAGRRFDRRSDEELRQQLTARGDVELFRTWHSSTPGWHYQFAVVRTRGSSEEARP